MRTNLDAIVTNRTVFGFGQDRAVATQVEGTCTHAAQHLNSWHASKRCRLSSRLYQRAGMAVMAGAARLAQAKRLAISGPGRQPVRSVSPVLVVA